MAKSSQAPALDQGVQSSAQVPGSPNHNSVYASVIPATVQLTADIYWLAQPYAVRVLRQVSSPDLQQPGTATTWTAIPPGDQLYGAAIQLASQGYTIDRWIMAIGNDPVVTMLLRGEMFIPYVAPLLSPNVFTPTPEQPLPVGPMPQGWIKTSLDPADYPSFYPPLPPPPPPGHPTNVVGNFQYDNGTMRFFGAGPGALAAYAAGTIKDGQPFTENGVSYTVHVTEGLMGMAISFSIPD